LAGEPGRGKYLSWLAYYAGVLEPAIMSKFQNIEVVRVTAGWAPLEEVIDALVKALAQGPYLLGEGFSAADVLYGTTFAMFASSTLLPKSPVIAEYAKRVVARPAYARAQLRDAG
jgi:glutathione S-transferase